LQAIHQHQQRQHLACLQGGAGAFVVVLIGFRRNCKDVLNHECSPGEKADLLAWLISLKP
jgi:hypothetical protein